MMLARTGSDPIPAVSGDLCGVGLGRPVDVLGSRLTENPNDHRVWRLMNPWPAAVPPGSMVGVTPTNGSFLIVQLRRGPMTDDEIDIQAIRGLRDELRRLKGRHDAARAAIETAEAAIDAAKAEIRATGDAHREVVARFRVASFGASLTPPAWDWP